MTKGSFLGSRKKRWVRALSVRKETDGTSNMDPRVGFHTIREDIIDVKDPISLAGLKKEMFHV